MSSNQTKKVKKYNIFFPKRLIKARKAQNISQGALAKVINISRTTITSYEKGGSEPSLDDLTVIAKFLNTTVDYLLGMDVQKLDNINMVNRDIEKQKTDSYNNLDFDKKEDEAEEEPAEYELVDDKQQIKKLNNDIAKLKEKNRDLESRIKGMLDLGKSMGLRTHIETYKQTPETPKQGVLHPTGNLETTEREPIKQKK